MSKVKLIAVRGIAAHLIAASRLPTDPNSAAVSVSVALMGVRESGHLAPREGQGQGVVKVETATSVKLN